MNPTDMESPVADPGDLLAHFRLVERIGQGGMGDVWKAVDTKLDREVAVKILPPALAQDPERLARFAGEAKAVAALNHPNIVTIHSVEEAGGVHFLTMELVRGQTLAELIPPGGLPVERFFEIAVPIASAVSAAHEQGVTHRDLKPGNIMVSDEGRVKVLDFGLAKFREPKTSADPDDVPTKTLTQEEEIRGTMPYMSPEQVQGKPLDQRSDIFSIGAVLYEMATGRRPFQGETSADLIAAILRDDPRPLTELNQAMPRQLQRIVRHAMERNPERRFQTTRDLRNELEALQVEIASGESRGVARPAPRGAPERKSLAVLPLENLSGDSAEEFFTDGMTDALITDLAKIGALKVISRSSVMLYKGTRKPLPEIARELGVGLVVEGSVLRAGDRVRIIAQLVDAATDEHLWAERYDRELQDVLALQSEVAQAIAGQIQVELTTQERARLADARTVNPEAHEAYLRGRHFWYKRTAEAVKKGLAYFEKAIELDPEYAPAYAGVADSYLVDGGKYLGVAPEDAYTRAREGALKALNLDDGLAEAYTSLAGVMSDYDWDWSGAEREYKRALELNPNYVTAHYWYADHLARMGRHDEAIAEARWAQEIDPLSLVSNYIVAWVLFFAREYDQAIAQARKTLELDPDYVAAYRVLGWAHEEKGQHEEAIAAHQKASSLSGDGSGFKGQLGRAYALAGKTGEASKILDDLLELSRKTPVSSLDIAITCTALGETDRAFEWLSKACDEHSEHIPYLKVDPRLDRLRSDPRFQSVLQRVGLSDDAPA